MHDTRYRCQIANQLNRPISFGKITAYPSNYTITLDSPPRSARRESRRAFIRKITKLTPDQVRKIQAEYAKGGIRYIDLAAKYNCSKRTIHKCIKREGIYSEESQAFYYS